MGISGNKNIPTQIPANKAIGFYGKAKIISGGKYHTMIVDYNDNIWVCGRNQSGSLGLGIYDERVQPTLIRIPNDPSIGFSGKAKAVATGSEHSAIIDLNDNIWTFGDN